VDRGAGFCTFNGLALAADAARKAGAQAILILDVDAHFGGGTFSIVSEWPGVWHADLSVSDFDGYRAAGHTRALVERVTRASDYLDTLRRMIDALSPVAFDLLIYNAGMDPFERCHMGGLPGVTRHVLDVREQLVFDWARSRRLSAAFVLAGGYTGAGVTRADLVALHLLTLTAANPGRPALILPGRAASRCPIGALWRAWDFLNLPRRELPRKAARFNVLEHPGRRVRALDVVWERGPHDALAQTASAADGVAEEPSATSGLPSHTHADVDLEGHHVHLDRVDGRKSGPGRSWTEIAAFVDDECVAHGWTGGCALGFGGSKHWPVVVAVTDTVSLVVAQDGAVSVHATA
jgi:hypothetical protein